MRFIYTVLFFTFTSIACTSVPKSLTLLEPDLAEQGNFQLSEKACRNWVGSFDLTDTYYEERKRDTFKSWLGCFEHALVLFPQSEEGPDTPNTPNTYEKKLWYFWAVKVRNLQPYRESVGTVSENAPLEFYREEILKNEDFKIESISKNMIPKESLQKKSLSNQEMLQSLQEYKKMIDQKKDPFLYSKVEERIEKLQKAAATSLRKEKN